jgi:uncharacterized phage protein (TIGR02218 family)
MPFDDLEISNYDSLPQTFYEFKLGPATWYYTNSAFDITAEGHTYIGLPISDNGIKQSGEVDTDDITITLPHSADFNTLFLGTPPSEEILATIKRRNFGASELVVAWVGTVKSNARDTARATNKVVCKMLVASLNRPGLRLSWGRNCPHALYDQMCRVDPADFATTVQVDSVVGNRITSAAVDLIDDHYLVGGYLEFIRTSVGAVERRAIEENIGSQINVLGVADGIQVGDFITVYPGCARTVAACKNKFNNLPNYGGFPHLPGKSPFDGDPVF